MRWVVVGVALWAAQTTDTIRRVFAMTAFHLIVPSVKSGSVQSSLSNSSDRLSVSNMLVDAWGVRLGSERLLGPVFTVSIHRASKTSMPRTTSGFRFLPNVTSNVDLCARLGFDSRIAPFWLLKIMLKLSEYFSHRVRDKNVSGTQNHHYYDMVEKSPELAFNNSICTKKKHRMVNDLCQALSPCLRKSPSPSLLRRSELT